MRYRAYYNDEAIEDVYEAKDDAEAVWHAQSTACEHGYHLLDVLEINEDGEDIRGL